MQKRQLCRRKNSGGRSLRNIYSIVFTMNIKQHDLVLEIGSGDNPNPRSDILCDRYIKTSHERAGEFRIRIDRPMVVADGMMLSFPDKTFDYVITSHIFEHMDDPAGFAREIMRVGKAGFIEVPSAISERVFGWNFHHWYCDIRGGVLTLSPKTEGERFGGFFHRLIAQNIWFRRCFEEDEGKWYVRMEWAGNIPIRVCKSPMSQNEILALDVKAWELLSKAKPEILKDLVFGIQFLFRRIIRKTRKIIRLGAWRLNKRKDLTNLIICPRCHGALLGLRGKLVCGRCKTDFPIDGVIPILLLPEEKRKGW